MMPHASIVKLIGDKFQGIYVAVGYFVEDVEVGVVAAVPTTA